jgi:hydrogenase maturation protease
MSRGESVVLGIGNTLLTDEGAGVHAVRMLERRACTVRDVRFVDGGTLSFTLAGAIAEADKLLVIDAAELGGLAGKVEVFVDEEMDRFLGTRRKRSVHEVGLLDLMQIARLTGCLPARRALIGIQPACVDWGERPTPAVERAIGEACRRALDLLTEWRT